ncbi:hypothetical protein SDC9_190284 [bioreactor metagenome]|uniref:Uncharacterized protein n=1 Tax=bioreactor metagenome TaxID=1076179 RepID=A0A645HUS9_9ZZZZ
MDVLVRLDEHTALDPLHLELPLPVGGAYGSADLHEADVLLLGEKVVGFLGELGCDHDLHEILSDLLRRGKVAVPVQRYDAAKGRQRIHGISGDECF